jgi:hypothetical protein
MSVETDAEVERDWSDRGLRDVALAGGLALVLSLVANAAVTTVARMAEIGEGLQAMQYPRVLVLTTVGVVSATVVYAALSRVTAKPDRNFVVVATVVLVVSIVPDFTFIPAEPGGSVTAGAVLAAMHVLAAVITVWLLVDWGRLRGTGNT